MIDVEYIGEMTPQDAYEYALKGHCGPWSEGEYIIALEAQWAYQYAVKAIRHRFYVGEKNIKVSKYQSDYEFIFHCIL